MTRAFRAPAWAWLLAAAGIAAFSTLGTWQLNRGRAKEQLMARLADATTPALTLGAGAAAPPRMAPSRAVARGTYVTERELRQDGQSHQQRPGRHAWTPLRLADGAIVVVDRGWIAGAALEAAAPPAGEVEVSGFWRALPEPGMRLAGTDNCPATPAFPLVVLYPTHAELECLLGAPVLPGLLLLDAAAPGGFVRDWQDPGFPPERHYGYAAQWYALGVATLVIFIVVNFKARRP